jgi:predicted Rossmann fold flavoprotein
MQKQLIIIGGGASGFFCAVNAAKLNPNLKIMLVEKQSKVLQKVKVSGGGRCNVTNGITQTSLLVQKYPRGKSFLKNTFKQFTTTDTINWFEERGVKLKTEIDGRVFPVSDSSQSIIDCLLNEVSKYKIELKLQTDIISIEKNNDYFLLETKKNEYLKADFVYIACGGFPKIEQYDWLKKLGHTIETPIPSLFTFNIPKHPLNDLMGVVVENAIVKIVGSKLQEQGPVLVTHWGLSGPAILRLSAWGAIELQQKNYTFSIIINWLGINENEVRNNWNTMRAKQSHLQLKNKNPFGLPTRLWDFILQTCQISPEIKWSELPSKEQNKLINTLTTHELMVNGKTTFKEEFVTSGGIKLDEVDANTMQSKLVPQLFFGGEILNIDGITGGFNFQNAWTCGFVAANHFSTLL